MTPLEKFLNPLPLPYDFQEWKNYPIRNVPKSLPDLGCSRLWFATFSCNFLFNKDSVLCFNVLWFCSFSNDLGSISEFYLWWTNPEALGKFIFGPF